MVALAATVTEMRDTIKSLRNELQMTPRQSERSHLCRDRTGGTTIQTEAYRIVITARLDRHTEQITDWKTYCNLEMVPPSSTAFARRRVRELQKSRTEHAPRPVRPRG
jgi:predicted PilT family ATPase